MAVSACPQGRELPHGNSARCDCLSWVSLAQELILNLHINRMTAEFFALAPRGDAIYDESVGSRFKIMTRNVNLPGVFVGGGCNLPRPLFLPGGIIQVGGIGSESIFRRKIDKDSKTFALVHLHGNRSCAASADVDGSPGADLRLIRGGYQARIRNEVLVPDHGQQQGQHRYGQRGTQPSKPS